MAKQAEDDGRFAQLIKDEYGVAVEGPGVPEDVVHRPPRTRRDKQPGKRWFSLDQAIDEAEPEYAPWDQFVAPHPEPLRRPRSRLAVIGVACILGAVVMAILWLLGVGEPTWLRGLGGVAVGAGLLCLLLSIPRRRPPDEDGGVVL